MPKFVRFVRENTPTYGIGDGDEIAVITPHPFTAHQPTGERVHLAGVRLLAPVIPSKVVCVGTNYATHAKEMQMELPKMPLIFLKPSSTIIGPNDAIALPTDLSDEVDHEAELAIIIGALMHRVDEVTAMAGVFGYTAANDVSARDFQRSESQWFRGKCFDTFLPLGPAIVTELDYANTPIRLSVNGQLRQNGNTNDLIFNIPRIISEISHVVTLLPGDVILTGTPAGVGRLTPGDTVRVEIDGIGVLVNPVIDRNAAQ
jgi:2-keto-4-pentenoate hydratase/2-oxohepta-3-ene-1,7-dioic acid hydratase in catechol pathway